MAGRIVKLSVADNQFVHKGDDLFEIDPADYRSPSAGAGPDAARRAARSTMPARTRTEKQSREQGWTSTDIYQQTRARASIEGVVALDKAAVAKAQLDLRRTVIRSPVNGYVTNLLAQLGDYATVGQKLISIVDAEFFLGRRLLRGDQSRPDPR